MTIKERPPTSAADEASPVDLDLRVTIVHTDGKDALQYVLHSPNGAIGYSFKEIQGKAFVTAPDTFQASLFKRIEKLHSGYGCGKNECLLLEEIGSELEDLGRWLYRELFPPELRIAYRRFRHAVTTLQITSDEPWIPWELVKPYDDSDPEEIIDDDFLCLEFQLTRWLAGDTAPAGAIPVTRLAAIGAERQTAGPRLPYAAREHEVLAALARCSAEVADASQPQITFTGLKQLLANGGLGLLHFVGHSEYAADHPDDSRIELADRPFRARNLSGTPQTRIRRDRPLVFLNTCHAARQGWALTGLGGWAEAWVRDCGCGAFIAPQWILSDRQAYEFARRFYSALRRGSTFGEATRQARLRLKNKEPGRLDWLAYSIYAHPNGRLLLGAEARMPAAVHRVHPTAGPQESLPDVDPDRSFQEEGSIERETRGQSPRRDRRIAENGEPQLEWPRVSSILTAAALLAVLLVFARAGFHRELPKPSAVSPVEGVEQPPPQDIEPEAAESEDCQGGERRTSDRDGLEYICIPPGDAEIACVAGDSMCEDDERPSHTVVMEHSFWLSSTEVTVAAYRRFTSTSRLTESRFNPGWEEENQPIVNVDWQDALAFCEWAGGRLPSEKEWEYAARGGQDGTIYPWGDASPECNDSPQGASFQDCIDSGPLPVGTYPENSFGLHDMAGNVWEWCWDPYAGSDSFRALRGGSWQDQANALRASNRRGLDRKSSAETIGFRCLRKSPP